VKKKINIFVGHQIVPKTGAENNTKLVFPECMQHMLQDAFIEHFSAMVIQEQSDGKNKTVFPEGMQHRFIRSQQLG